jgi:hypothetical protein
MANKVLLKKSSVASRVPAVGDLDYGELALNYTDGKLYFKNASNVIKSFTIDDAVVTLTGTQTLTNKTLTSPNIYNPTFTQNGGDEGGEVKFALAATGTTLNTSVTVDIYQDKFRIFETGGTSRGVFINLAGAAASVGSELSTSSSTQTLTNKTIAAGSNTISGLTNSNLSGSAGITNANLANSAVTVGTTAIALGSSSTTLAGLTSVTSTSFVGALTGNASTATTLQTARSINGVSFNGSANITVTATATNALTIGTGLSGTSYNGSGAVTIAIDSTVATLTGTQTLTNKTLTSPTVSGGTINNTVIGGTTAAAITGTNLVATGTLNVTGATVLNGGLTMDTNKFTVADTTGNTAIGGTLAVTGATTMSAALAMSSNKITGLGAPTASTDAATKQYVDEVAQGIIAKPSVRAATTTNLSANYNNGTLGVGATLTADTNRVFTTLDGVTNWAVTSPPMGVLVKNQTNSAHNGRYNLTTLGSASTPWVLTKCGLCDEADEIPGAYVFVSEGTQAGTGWVQTVLDPDTFVVGTDAVIVTQFSGAGTYTAGTGLTLTGSAFSVNAAQTQITSVGTLTGGTWNASVIAGQYGGTGVANTGKTITIGGNFTTSGAHTTTLTTTGNTGVTLPTTGTLATLSGTETFTNKTISGTSNTLSNIGNASLTNSSLTIGSTTVSLGATATTLAGLTSVTSTTFVGALTGNASTATSATNSTNATNASQVFVGLASANSAFKVPFADTTVNTAGNYSLLQDTESTFTYNPSTNTLTAGTFSGALSGNATTATTLQTARSIGGVSFNGSANINLPGVNTAGNQNTSGTAAVSTAATITTSATASAFKVPFANTTASTTGNYGLLQDSEATFTYNPSTNTLTVGTVAAALTGNASTATSAATLTTARTINTVSFNGSANIVVEPYVENDDSTNATRYITFVDSSTAGHQRLNEDSNFTINPSTGTVTTNGAFASTFALNKNTIDVSYSIPSGYNAVAAGPVVINNGITVTIPTGSTWVIV